MTDLRQLAKEEIVKNIIDKLIFGLIAALVIFGLQKCSDTYQRAQIEREAILRLDSEFILNEAKRLQTTFSDYVSVVTESITLGLPPNREKQQQLLILKVKVESSIEALSVHRSKIKTDSAVLINLMESLNSNLRSFDSTKTDQYESELQRLKSKYRSLLEIIKTSAIDSLPN